MSTKTQQPLDLGKKNNELTFSPKLTGVLNQEHAFEFTLSDVPLSLANSIRLTIESDIPAVVFYTENYVNNKCNIEINTTRMHNELIKQRLSCIPIHSTDLEALPANYIMEVDVKNETDNVIYVTSGDFKIKHKNTGEYMSREQVDKIFPKCEKTGYYIDLVALRPRISDSILGEQLKLKCDFSVSTRRVNGAFSVTSKCVNAYTQDPKKVADAWEAKREVLKEEGNNDEEIEFDKKNFYLLDAQRHFIPDSYDFKIKSVGVYDEPELVKMACGILHSRFNKIVDSVESEVDDVRITVETALKNSYDIHIANEDYAIGYAIQHIMSVLFMKTREQGGVGGNEIMSFCGFVKQHPFNNYCVIRVAYVDTVDKSVVRDNLKAACEKAKEFYNQVYKLF